MNSYRAILESTKFDVLLCDHFTVPCVDIAKNLNVPMIITTALAISQGNTYKDACCYRLIMHKLDASAPYLNNFLESNDTTSEYMSFYDRIYAKLAQPFSIVMEIKSVIDETKKKKAELGWLPTEGIPAFEDNWKDSIKLVNNLFGFEPARPLGPLVELIGPIMSTEYPDLTPKEQAFLESHHKVAYVAFGQSAKIERKEIELILTALIDAIEKGALDGFIWATRDSKESFPETIVSFSEKTYSVSHMFDGLNENTLFLQWAPQMAILSHPSTTLFVSHGGLASLHEATYAGVRTALYPFYGDQPSNSYMMRTQNLGVQLSLDMQQPEFSKLIEQIALDENGTYQKNVDRFKAMVQIHAKHGTLRGADLVEEVIFTNNNGKLTHRYEASRNMSFFKARNLDLYGFVLFVFLALIGASIYSINYLYNSTLDVLDSQKIKNQSKYRLVDQDNKKTK